MEEVDVATCVIIRTNYLSPCEKGARQIKKTVDEKNTKTGTQQKLVLLKVISVDVTFFTQYSARTDRVTNDGVWEGMRGDGQIA